MIGLMVPSAFADTWNVVVNSDFSGDPSCADNDTCVVPSSLVIEKGDIVAYTLECSSTCASFHFDVGTVGGGTSEENEYPPNGYRIGYVGSGASDTSNDITYDKVGVYPYFDPSHPWYTFTITVVDDVNDLDTVEADAATVVNETNEDFPVAIKITTTKNSFEYGEAIRLKLQFEPSVPNTPLFISLQNENGISVADRDVRPSHGDDGDFERTGTKFITIYPKLGLPSDNYTIHVQFGTDDMILGTQTSQEISYTNNNSSIGNQLFDKYALDVLDVGTNFGLIEHGKDQWGNTMNLSLHQDSLISVHPCEYRSFECPISITQSIRVYETYHLNLYKFESEINAQKYASLHRQWDGAPSNKANYFLVGSTYENVPEKCFEFKGGFSSANGPDGLYKCSKGKFVVEVHDRDEYGKKFVSYMIDKLDSETDAHENISSESLKEQKIESKPILSFVDPEKDPSHYVKRYITEETYKDWFSEHFPDYTLYEGIGITQEEYRNIVNELTKPEPVPEPVVTPEPEPEPEPTPTQESSEGGGCLIATAAYGSEMAPQVQFLREIRDGTVMSTESGTAFMTGFNQFYYSFSPQIADYERENPVFKEAVKVTLTPLLTSLTLLNYVEIDSEEEMLGYGIGIILLNVGMYFVAPAVLIISLKKKFQK